jgi:hypothetical protein
MSPEANELLPQFVGRYWATPADLLPSSGRETRVVKKLTTLRKQGLVTDWNVLRELGVVVINVDASRIEQAREALQTIAEFTSLVQARHIDVQLD